MNRGIQNIIQSLVPFLYKSTATNIMIPQNILFIKNAREKSRETTFDMAFSITTESLQKLINRHIKYPDIKFVMTKE